MGPAYFREATEVINAATGGPPPLQAMMDLFRRHGMTIATPPVKPNSRPEARVDENCKSQIESHRFGVGHQFSLFKSHLGTVEP